MRRLMLLLSLPLLRATAAAQMPAAWAQAAGGIGFAGRQGDYSDNADYIGEVRAGIQLGSRFGVEGSALVTTPIVTGAQVTNLTLCGTPGGPFGPCPEPARFSISGGGASVVRALNAATRVSLGVGSYVLSRYRTDLSSTRGLGVLVGADIDVFPVHPKITVGLHPIYMPNVRGSYQWFVPVDVGVRAW